MASPHTGSTSPTGSIAAINSQVLPFPIGETLASGSFPATDLLVGLVFDGPKGSKWRLVRASAAVATAALAAKKVFQYSAAATYDVALATAATHAAVGVTADSQVAIADNDLFWLQVAGTATCIDSGLGLTALNVVSAAATGDVAVVTPDAAGIASNTDFGYVLTTASANADVSIHINGTLG